MRRCFELARIPAYKTGANPMVGSILVSENRIIGEGYYRSFGAPHAEIIAIKSVKDDDRHLISASTLYVSLEPCCIYGKTPPCSEAILNAGIKKVVISVLDPNPKMNGQSVELLRSKGIEVTTGVLAKEGNDLIRYFKAQLEKRPYIILKFAQSSDGYFGKRGKQVWISHPLSQYKVHLWRSQTDGILAGKNTIEIDDPSLTVRKVSGTNPARLILDSQLQLSHSLKVWADQYPSIFFCAKQGKEKIEHPNKDVINLGTESIDLHDVMREVFQRNIHSVLVEGGVAVIKSLLESGLWDEARIIRSQQKMISGIRAPLVKGRLYHREKLGTDQLDYVFPN